MSTLYIVATPIGNLSDASARSIEVLGAVDCILAEDTRRTRKLLDRYDLRTPLISLHEHNEASRIPRVIGRLEAGENLALVSDAGTPLVSDPGYRLVKEAISAGIAVTTLPGPSSVMAALSLAGLPTDRFMFAGFLPAKTAGRKRALREIAQVPATLVLLESARRLVKSLADMALVLGPRQAAVARELTKKFEQVRRGPLDELAAHYQREGPPRGEITVVVAPPAAAVKADEGEVDRLLAAALATSSTRDAAAQVAAATGHPRRQLYTRALQIAKDGQ